MARVSSGPSPTVRRHRGSAGGTPLLLPPAAAPRPQPRTAVVTGRGKQLPAVLGEEGKPEKGNLKNPKKSMRKEAANVKWVTHDTG